MTHCTRNSIAALLLALVLICFAGIASAHVTVQPQQTTQGSYDVFTVRVPGEKDGVWTTKVKIRVPEGVNVTRTEPKPDWKAELEKGADGKIVSVTWTAAEGKGLASSEFTEFKLSGKVAGDASQLEWKAYQTYSDNSTVEWIGAEDSEYPAAVTAVAAGTGTGDGHGGAAGSGVQNSGSAADGSGVQNTGASSPGNNAAAGDAPDTSGTGAAGGVEDGGAVSGDDAAGTAAGQAVASNGNVPLYLSVAALVLGAAALITALAGRRKR